MTTTKTRRGPVPRITRREATDAMDYLHGRATLAMYAKRHGISHKANVRSRITTVVKRALEKEWLTLGFGPEDLSTGK